MAKETTRIKKCCASCAFKRLTRTTLRRCVLHDKLVRSGYTCENWQASKLIRQIRDGRPMASARRPQ